MTAPPLLQVRDLTATFTRGSSATRVVQGISFDIAPGEAVGFVGESGCGKSVTARAIMRLAPEGTPLTVGGSIRYRGQELTDLPEPAMRDIRGRRIAMVFQDPMSSLNPVMTIGAQIDDMLRRHGGLSRQAARRRTIELLGLVGIRDPALRADDHPHQFSGGMRQRVLIAIAVSCQPDLLIADEPTTALDVTIQAQILKLMIELKSRIGAAILLITHDLGVVAETCQRVVVMYAGRKVEEASVLDLFDRPLHPYTRGLMASIPRHRRAGPPPRRLQEIPGIVPNLRDPIAGCAFAPRCPLATARCTAEAPSLRSAGTHSVACWEVTP